MGAREDRGAGRLSRLPRSPRRVGAAASAAAVLLVPAGARAAPRVAPDQPVAAMLSTHTVRSSPKASGRVVASVAARRPITGERTVLPVLGQAVDGSGRFWLHVRLPGRTRKTRPPPTGWISATSTQLSSTPWHIVVDVRARRVVVYEGGVEQRRLRAIVGKPSTPTPRGEYFVEENVRLSAKVPGAPFALALSARSNVLQEFEGGPGQIALHGLENLGGQLGSAASHGCVRLGTGDVTWLAATIEPGVPVSIV
jgi:lipoprotein-anchoring transpeptidase ErfK/SrfK